MDKLTSKELQELESKCVMAALKRGDVRTVRALTVLAMLRPIQDKPNKDSDHG